MAGRDQAGEVDFSPEEITEALNRVVASNAFSRSERARALLRHLVDETVAGRAELLKGFSIAQDVFGRSDDFDPQGDAVVRVQAGRMRELIAAYYLGEGAQDPVRLEVPKGTYVPTFTRSQLAVEEQAAETVKNKLQTALGVASQKAEKQAARQPVVSPEVPVSSFIVRNIRVFFILLALILMTTLAILYFTLQDRPREVVATQQDVLQLAEIDDGLPLLRVVSLPGGAQSPETVQALATLRREVSQFSTVALTSEGTAVEGRRADFDLNLSAVTDRNASLELLDRSTNEVIWAGIFQVDPLGELTDRSSAILTLLMAGDGVIYSALDNRGEASRLMVCIRQTQAYFRAPNEQRFQQALSCSDALVRDGIEHSLADADRASLISEGQRGARELGDASADDALQLARRATQAAPGSAYAYRALATALYANREGETALDAMTQAYEFNPHNLNIAAAYGFALFQAGNYQLAAEKLGRATIATRTALPWWNYFLFLSATAISDEDTMIRAANRLPASDRRSYHAVRIVAAQLTGNQARLATLLEALQDNQDLRLTDPSGYFAKRLPADASARLNLLLEQAGY